MCRFVEYAVYNLKPTHKGLWHIQILVTEKVPEPIPHGYTGLTILLF